MGDLADYLGQPEPVRPYMGGNSNTVPCRNCGCRIDIAKDIFWLSQGADKPLCDACGQRCAEVARAKEKEAKP